MPLVHSAGQAVRTRRPYTWRDDRRGCLIGAAVPNRKYVRKVGRPTVHLVETVNVVWRDADWLGPPILPPGTLLAATWCGHWWRVGKGSAALLDTPDGDPCRTCMRLVQAQVDWYREADRRRWAADDEVDVYVGSELVGTYTIGDGPPIIGYLGGLT